MSLWEKMSSESRDLAIALPNSGETMGFKVLDFSTGFTIIELYLETFCSEPPEKTENAGRAKGSHTRRLLWN